MQIIKLVENGKQDKMIGFEELPGKYLKDLRKDPLVGYRREWGKYSDCTYELFYKDINRDIERWAEISSFCKRVVDPSFRLDDKIENMALAVASNQTEDVKIYPEDVKVIPIPLAHQDKIVVPPTAKEKTAEEPTEEKVVKHTCENKGRGGRLEEEGECVRCDELRARKPVEV